MVPTEVLVGLVVIVKAYLRGVWVHYDSGNLYKFQ